MVVAIVLTFVMIERAADTTEGVIVRNMAFGERFLAGDDPYMDPVRGELIHGPYPPSFVWVCAPLATLPRPLARRVWCLAQIGALVGLYSLLRRRLAESSPDLVRHMPALFTIALLLVSRFVLRDMKGGGGNLLYGLLAVFAIDRSLRDRQVLAGLALSAGLLVKPNLAPVLFFLLLRRRWRTLATVAIVVPLLFAAPGLWYGTEAYFALVKRWLTDVLTYANLHDLHDSTLVPEGMPAAESAMNQSLRESVHRLLRPPGDSGAYDIHWIEVAPLTAVRIAQGIALSLLAGLSWRALRARDAAEVWFLGLAFLPLCLLLSPVTWKAHHAVLLPFVFQLVWMAKRLPSRRRWLIGVFLIYYVVCNLANTEVLGQEAGDYMQSLSVVAWADVLMVLAAIPLSVFARQIPSEPCLRP
ncbi:glycosyltransferase family 87 protein [Saltatorellus ferox]